MEGWKIGRPFPSFQASNRSQKLPRFAFLFRVIISRLLFNSTYAPAAPRLVSPIPPTSVCALQQ